jgi:hypothetical protein
MFDKKTFFAIFVASQALTGCAGSIVGDALAGPEKLAAQDDAYCQSIGAVKDSPQYTDCRLRVTQMRETKHNAVRAGALSGPVVCNRYGATTICN